MFKKITSKVKEINKLKIYSTDLKADLHKVFELFSKHAKINQHYINYLLEIAERFNVGYIHFNLTDDFFLNTQDKCMMDAICIDDKKVEYKGTLNDLKDILDPENWMNREIAELIKSSYVSNFEQRVQKLYKISNSPNGKALSPEQHHKIRRLYELNNINKKIEEFNNHVSSSLQEYYKENNIDIESLIKQVKRNSEFSSDDEGFVYYFLSESLEICGTFNIERCYYYEAKDVIAQETSTLFIDIMSQRHELHNILSKCNKELEVIHTEIQGAFGTTANTWYINPEVLDDVEFEYHFLSVLEVQCRLERMKFMFNKHRDTIGYNLSKLLKILTIIVDDEIREGKYVK